MLKDHAKFLVKTFDKFTVPPSYLVPAFLVLELNLTLWVSLTNASFFDIVALILTILHGVVLYFHVQSLSTLRSLETNSQFREISEQHLLTHAFMLTKAVLMVVLQMMMISREKKKRTKGNLKKN